MHCGSCSDASKGTSKIECKREAFKDKPKASNKAHGVMLNLIKTFLRMQP